MYKMIVKVMRDQHQISHMKLNIIILHVLHSLINKLLQETHKIDVYIIPTLQIRKHRKVESFFSLKL